MSISMRPSIKLSGLAVLLLALALPAWADSHNYGSSNSGGGYATASPLKNSTTNGLIRDLQRAFKKCLKLDPVYRYDCYDDAYDKGAAKLAGKPGYEQAQAALAQVGADIQAIVAQNIDPAQPVLKKSGKVYRPIQSDQLPTAKAGVIQSIEQAQTVLLRVPDKGDHFARIANALESNKVLLRSALRWLSRQLRLA